MNFDHFQAEYSPRNRRSDPKKHTKNDEESDISRALLEHFVSQNHPKMQQKSHQKSIQKMMQNETPKGGVSLRKANSAGIMWGSLN